MKKLIDFDAHREIHINTYYVTILHLSYFSFKGSYYVIKIDHEYLLWTLSNEFPIFDDKNRTPIILLEGITIF